MKGTITCWQDAAAKTIYKELIFKNCFPFTNHVSEINNTQVDNAKDLDVAMQMYNLIVDRNDCSKTSRILNKLNLIRDLQENSWSVMKLSLFELGQQIVSFAKQREH